MKDTKEIRLELKTLNELVNDADDIIELKAHYTELLAHEKTKEKNEKSYLDYKSIQYHKELDRCDDNLVNISSWVSKIANRIQKLA